MGENALVLSPHYCLYEGNYRSAAAITDVLWSDSARISLVSICESSAPQMLPKTKSLSEQVPGQCCEARDPAADPSDR
jgi:hypothetical protein